ncbi:MAG TPA: flagellar motor protein MotB [Bacteroidales bacterium]|nr:flagellar motor protein MotB [Bacteroidales bacterium]
MRPKQEEEAKKGAPAFMNTYGDMMTLLLVFFVLLFSMSTIDVEKYKAFVSSFAGGEGILDGETILESQILLGNGMNQYPDIDPPPIDSVDNELEDQGNRKAIEEMAEEIREYFIKHDLDQKLEVGSNGEYISIKFDDILLFDTGKANLKPGAIPVLDKVGIMLAGYLKNPQLRLGFEGHTDNVPINTTQFPSNWELSAARAIAVAKFYIEEMSFNPSQISTEGFGQHVPIGPNESDEGRAANRRVEIKIISEPNR